VSTAPPAAATADPVALAGRLRPVLLHLTRHLRRETHALGLSAGQVSILAVVRDTPGVGVAELAAREGTSVPSICAHVDKLEAAALVSRQRDLATDRRRVGLAISPEGERVLRTVRSRRTAWLASRLAAISPEQRAAVEAAIDGLTALVDRA
jgi:DNA-binding MarR family transcriptional regulator